MRKFTVLKPYHLVSLENYFKNIDKLNFNKLDLGFWGFGVNGAVVGGL